VVGPVNEGQACETEGLAALEALQVLLEPRAGAKAPAAKPSGGLRMPAIAKPAVAARKPEAAKPVVTKPVITPPRPVRPEPAKPAGRRPR
jgi:hypothetical protein